MVELDAEHPFPAAQSAIEGADKPLKYPHVFRSADLVLLKKVDLLPYVEFDVDRFAADARKLNPGIAVLPLSATKGDGVADWLDWLRERLAVVGRLRAADSSQAKAGLSMTHSQVPSGCRRASSTVT